MKKTIISLLLILLLISAISVTVYAATPNPNLKDINSHGNSHGRLEIEDSSGGVR